MKKEDIWFAMAGSIADNYMPEFKDEFSKLYPELWKKEINSAFQALYETDFGKIIQMLAFALKDRTSSVVNMTNFLISVNSPNDVFIENEKNSKILRRYSQVYKVYSKLLENAKSILELGLGHGFSTRIFSKKYKRHVVLEGSTAVIKFFKKQFPDCKSQIIKVYFEYLNFILNQTLPKYKLGEGSNKRLGTERMKEVQIEIPIDKNGEFDLDKQREIAEKHRKIEEIKTKLKDNYEKIINSKVQII